MTLIELLERVQVALASGIPESAEFGSEYIEFEFLPGGKFTVDVDVLTDERNRYIWSNRTGTYVAR